MPFNGTGTYDLPAPPSPFLDGTTASATDMMTVLYDIQNALTKCVTADGQTSATKYTLTDGSETYTLTVASKSFTLTDTTASADRLTVSSAGVVAINKSLTVGTGLTVTAGGVTATGDSTITGKLGGITGLTVASGGATITGNSTITGTLGGLTGLTVASGGAAITGNSSVTGTLAVSSTLTAANGTSGTQVVNYSQFASTLAISGQRIYPDGSIEKWGAATLPITGTSTTSVAVAFSAAFPTAVWNVQVTPTGSSSGGGYNPICIAQGATTAGFTIAADTNSPGNNFVQLITVYWRALGN